MLFGPKHNPAPFRLKTDVISAAVIFAGSFSRCGLGHHILYILSSGHGSARNRSRDARIFSKHDEAKTWYVMYRRYRLYGACHHALDVAGGQ